VGGGSIYDANARTVDFSSELWALLGLPERTDWPLDEALALWSQADRAIFAAPLEQAIRDGQRLEFEGRLDLANTSETWLRVVGDALRVRQVINGLVDNALKFTLRGEVRIILDREPDGVAISVADTGPGVPSAVQARLFEPFFQGDSSLTRRHGGVGLGLAICRELTRLMGGAITVESVVGHGATFTVRLPLQFIAPKVETAADTPLAFRTLRILVAEDNPANQLVIICLLDVLGIQPRMVAASVISE